MGGLKTQLLCFLDSISKLPIRQIARILFEHQGEVSEDGPLELGFDGQKWLFGNESDGETLSISRHGWSDPFGETTTLENQLFIEECGKWSRVDVSFLEPYRNWIGKPISGAVLLVNEFGTPAGIELSNAESSLCFLVRGDECFVLLERPPDYEPIPT